MQQMMELLVEMELMHQPYCQSPLQNDVATYTQLLYKSTSCKTRYFSTITSKFSRVRTTRTLFFVVFRHNSLG